MNRQIELLKAAAAAVQACPPQSASSPTACGVGGAESGCAWSERGRSENGPGPVLSAADRLHAILPLEWAAYGDDALVGRESADGPLLARVRPPKPQPEWVGPTEAVPWWATIYPPGHPPCEGEGFDAETALRAAMGAAWAATAKWRATVGLFAPKETP